MTKLHEAALETENLITTLEDENARLKIQNSELQNQVHTLEDTYVRLQEAAGRALAERDYYMRECAELEGKFTSFCSIAMEAINTHRMAPFRPNGAAPKDEPAKASDDSLKAVAEANGLDDAIPAFLTKPQAELPEELGGLQKTSGQLKLRRRT